jgi:hypothetical protein
MTIDPDIQKLSRVRHFSDVLEELKHLGEVKQIREGRSAAR